MSTAAIEIEGLSKRFGPVTAVDSVDVRVEQGEILGLLGPSGCGKTTILRCVAGLEVPDTGTVRLNGHTVFASGQGISVPAEARGVGMVFQSYALWPHMTVLDNVMFAVAHSPTEKSDRSARVHEALASVGLSDLSDRYPAQLSGGQQQRVAVARAIAPRPEILLFDEPLSNLDARLRDELRLELKGILRKVGASALYVTHDQREAMALCDRVAVMRTGRIHQIDTPTDVYRYPRDAYVAHAISQSSVLRCVPADSGMGSTSVVPIERRTLDRLGAPEWAYGHNVAEVVVRPEGVLIASKIDHDMIDLQVEVLESLFVGAHYELLLQVVGTEVTLRAQHLTSELGPGAVCGIRLQPEGIHFLSHTSKPSTVDHEHVGGARLSERGGG